ncbi:NfeD family protein [Thermomonospora cellulosilytica]|uniref:Membrane protein implicated in regulation of membrane protease activity n=1 Tax=Thermomonospora cellulosilytica TaxID=1411118 RepID=A0A7W3MU10_9ACTN|nr:NfeD family protein [Thermomonospora cellulosilytica]MBA9001854.1 membrane protein implicated in regulation of membrane protease activity [Thermomonospora cellulosilytica]
MDDWLIWLIVAAVLGVAELLTLTLALGLLAVAAVAAAVAGVLGAPVVIQAVVFVIASAAGLGVVRPIARRHISQPPPLRTGTAALVGKQALTLTEVSKRGGLVRLAGEEWTARPYDPDLVIPADAEVDVLAIEGAIALVYPRE